MTLSHQLEPGSRVRTIRKTGAIPKGSSGTVVRVFVEADCADVLFDAYPEQRFVAQNDLEVITELSAKERS